jgi:LPPG:FO 2-phospho-L-lactate transferase
MAPLRVLVLAGGVGGAKGSHGFLLAGGARARRGERELDLTVVVNTGDDLELHGLYVAPDLDTVMYTLAGLVNPETGWGLEGETWSASAMLERYGQPTWFRLGDGDLATHIVRTRGLRSGRSLTDITRDLAARLGIAATILPVSDEAIRTELRAADGWLEFQDYFVRRRQGDEVLELRYRGIEEARPTPDVLAAVGTAEVIVLAPSNPFVSIGTILAVPGMLDALLAAPAPVIAVSPIVGGHALKGPADRMLVSLGWAASSEGIVALYEARHPGLVDAWVLDQADAEEAGRLIAGGRSVLVTATVMRTLADRERLAESILALATGSERAVQGG